MDYKLIKVPQQNRTGKLLNVAYQRSKMDHKTFFIFNGLCAMSTSRKSSQLIIFFTFVQFCMHTLLQLVFFLPIFYKSSEESAKMIERICRF